MEGGAEQDSLREGQRMTGRFGAWGIGRVMMLLIETGKSRGGASLRPAYDEFILRHIDPDLLTVGHLGRALATVQFGKIKT